MVTLGGGLATIAFLLYWRSFVNSDEKQEFSLTELKTWFVALTVDAVSVNVFIMSRNPFAFVSAFTLILMTAFSVFVMAAHSSNKKIQKLPEISYIMVMIWGIGRTAWLLAQPIP